MDVEHGIHSSQKLNKNGSSEFTIRVKDVVLTSHMCATIVNETLKCLVYNKSQIPYPYNWLTLTVQRKRKGDPELFENFKAERHFQVASSAVDVIEDLMKSIKEEFSRCGGDVREVVVMFGATPYMVKEAYTIRFTNIAKGHLEENHKLSNRKNQHKVMKDLMFSQEWLAAMQNQVPLTNTYVLIKKHVRSKSEDEEGQAGIFMSNEDFSLPARAKNTVIVLEYDDSKNSNCCSNIKVFEDSQSEADGRTEERVGENVNFCWEESKLVLKGFKDCIVNNKSATELWF